MRILLNLLPEGQKEALHRRFRFRFFTWQTTLLFCLELFYVGILLGILFLLNNQVKMAETARNAFDEYNSEAKKLTLYQEKFKVSNATALQVERYTKNHLHWTNLLTLLDKLTGEGIVIVNVLTKDYTVTLNGQAKTRDDFLVFEENLKKADCISDVKVPISNLFSQKEVDFQVDFNVKRECLLKNKK